MDIVTKRLIGHVCPTLLVTPRKRRDEGQGLTVIDAASNSTSLYASAHLPDENRSLGTSTMALASLLTALDELGHGKPGGAHTPVCAASSRTQWLK